MNKTCRTCGLEKDVESFGKGSDYYNDCRICQQKKLGKPIGNGEDELYLHRKDGTMIIVYIDPDDYEKCSIHKWCFTSGRYAGYNYSGRMILLHRFIMNIHHLTGHSILIDHKDGNGLNNRKSNLRQCNVSENAINKTKLSVTNTSGYNGIEKYNDRWLAGITCYGKTIRLGIHPTINEAIKARREAELKYFGEFAPIYHEQLILGDKDIL